MPKVYFISENLLKSSTNLNDNIDIGALRSSISTAQDINCQESLSTKLYNKIVDLVDTGAITATTNSNYKTLLDDYIQPMVLHYSYYYALDAFLMKVYNVGLVQGSSEQGSPIDVGTFKMMKSNARNTAEFYDNRLREHLYFNDELYPEYELSTTDGDLPASRTNGILSQIVMDEKMYPLDYDPLCCKKRYYRL